MGRSKHQIEVGRSPVEDKFVCAGCVDDEDLKLWISKEAEAQDCSYCNASDEAPIAASVDSISGAIHAVIQQEYAEPAGAGVPFESAEGGYQDETLSTREVLEVIGLDGDERFIKDVIGSIHNDHWVKAAGGHWLGQSDSTILKWSWDSFSSIVTTQQRYFFTLIDAIPYEPDELTPSELLKKLGGHIAAAHLFTDLRSGTLLYRVRARQEGESWIADAGSLGAPPPGIAGAGRLNPAGIPYLYLAAEESTALAEVAPKQPSKPVYGVFRVERPLRLITLTGVIPLPNRFDVDRYQQREQALFLRAFVAAMSKPIKKDGFEHVSYVPSQIVSEYFAHVFTIAGARLDGIMYDSTVQPGGRNVVLFPARRDQTYPGDAVTFVSAHE